VVGLSHFDRDADPIAVSTFLAVRTAKR
jgi:hypothetical protein